MITESLEEVPLTADEAAFAAQQTGLLRFCALRVQRRNPGEDLDDLIGDGTLGLLRAVRRHDPSLGFKFSGYAVRSIEWDMLSAILRRSRHKRGEGVDFISVDQWGEDEERFLHADDDTEADAVEAALARVAIEALPERWRPVVAYLVGFKTVAEVAAEMGVGKCRVRQIGERARATMRIALWDLDPDLRRTPT